MPIINIKKLKKLNEDKRKMDIETYNKILTKFYNKINYLGEIGKEECWFLVPHFILGIPPYDLKKCVNYIKKEINSVGFTTVEFYDPNIFYVSWV